MNALVWTGPRQMQLQDEARPSPAPDEVLVRVSYAGICGSELSGYLGQNSLRVPPLIMGHEFSGEIAELGERADAAGLREGQAVTVNPLSCDEDSEFRRRGLEHLCPTRKLLGAHRPGAYAQYVTVRAGSVLPLPDGMSLRDGALTEPVACAVRIGELAGDVAGRDCLVIGAGPIGLLTLQVLRLAGARRVFIADRDPERLAIAGSLGGETVASDRAGGTSAAVREATSGAGVAVAVDAVGAAVTRHECVAASASAGTVILSGLHEEVSTIPAADVIRREIVLRGSFAYTPVNFARGLALLARGEARLDPWIVEAPLRDGGEWFERLLSSPGGVAKVLLIP